MAVKKFDTFSVRLDRERANHLAELAENAGRSKGAIIKRLLDLADVRPDLRLALGCIEQAERVVQDAGSN